MSDPSSSSPTPSASPVKNESIAGSSANQSSVNDIQRMQDHINQLGLSLAQMRMHYGMDPVPPLADPPPPPPRPFQSSDRERQADPPRHSSVVGPRGVTPHPAAVSSFNDGYDQYDLPDRKYGTLHDDRADDRSRRTARFDDTSSSSSTPSYRPAVKLPSMKLPDPPKFDGNVMDPNKLEDYIMAMERYLRAYGVDHRSQQSYTYTATSLTGRASRWLNQIDTRDPDSITSWHDLKTELRKVFMPVAVSQLAFGRLQKVAYTKDVAQLNHDFMEQLTLLPKYNNEQFDEIMVQTYLEALMKGGPGTRFLATNLRMRIADHPGLTLRAAMDAVLLAEAHIGRPVSGDRRDGAVATVLSSRSFARSSSSSSNWRSRFSRSSPIKQPSFSTPQAKLHNAAADPFDDYEDDTETNAAAEIDREMFGEDMNEESTREPTFHADVDEGEEHEHGDPFAGVPNDIALNMIRFARRFGDVNNLTADELDRRRRNNLCFNCGGVGHRSRDCKKPRPTPQGAGAGGSSNNKSQSQSQNNKRHF